MCKYFPNVNFNWFCNLTQISLQSQFFSNNTQAWKRFITAIVSNATSHANSYFGNFLFIYAIAIQFIGDNYTIMYPI